MHIPFLQSDPFKTLNRKLVIVINSFIFDDNGGGQNVTSCLAAKLPGSEPPIP
jgi:hypothetical protein